LGKAKAGSTGLIATRKTCLSAILPNGSLDVEMAHLNSDALEVPMGMREDYQALIEKQFKEWQAQTERFKATAAQMEAQAKAQFEKNLELLRASQAQAWENFGKFKEANESAWAEFKAHMEKAGAELRSAAESMTRSLKP
jgi:hypothetical protein